MSRCCIVVLCAAFTPLSVGRAQTPRRLVIAAVTQAADFQPGIAQAGSLTSVFVSGLEGGPDVVTASNTHDLNGIRVWVDSAPAPILAVGFFDGYQQINIQVPWETQTPRMVAVAQNGVQASTGRLGPASPELSVFFTDAHGYAVLQHAFDSSMVTPGNPAHPGETLIAYAQNLGPVTNQPLTGAPSPYLPLAYSMTPSSGASCLVVQQLTLNSPTYSASMPYVSVLTPGLVGVYQLAFTVPPASPAGDLRLATYRHAFAMSGLFPRGCSGISTFTSRSVLLPVR